VTGAIPVNPLSRTMVIGGRRRPSWVMARTPKPKRDVDTVIRRVMVPLPYVLLGFPALLALPDPEQTATEHLITLGLVLATALWIFLLHTRWWPARLHGLRREPVPDALHAPTLRDGVYCAGQTLLAAVLVVHHPIFYVFAVVGFIQAFELLPAPLGFVQIAASSAIVNLLPSGFPDNRGWLVVSLVAILLQTGLIGWFGYLSQRAAEESHGRKRTLAELEAALAENAGLHAQLLAQAREAGVHDERQRMAREIHDTLAQGLTGIITQLQAADRAREQPAQWQRHMGNVHTLAKDSLAAARRSVAALAPAELEASHLPGAVQDLAVRWSTTSGVPVQVEVTGAPRPVLADVEVTLFRAAQEGLANVARHAAAGKVGLTLSYLDDAVMLDLRDDGAGFDPEALGARGAAADGTGYGLAGIRQRLVPLGGALVVESAPGEGTAINVTVPLGSGEGAP
jgi:signal transduction histidine kinase